MDDEMDMQRTRRPKQAAIKAPTSDESQNQSINMPRQAMPAVIDQPTNTYAGCREVTKEEFYKLLAPTAGNASIINSYEYYGRGYVTEHYRTMSKLDGVFGYSEGGDFPFTKPRYFVKGGL